MNPRSRFWLLAEHSITIFVFIFLVVFTYARFFGIPYVGFTYNPSDGEVIQVFGDPSPENSLQPGDQLLQVGSISWGEYRGNARRSFVEGLKAGQVVEVQVLRDGQALTIPWTLPGPNPKEFRDRLANVWVLAYIFWLAGAATSLLVRPKDERWVLLIAFNYLTAVWIAAGNPIPNAPSNQLGAEIKAAGTSKYVVIVYNRSQGIASYTLKAENATLVDDAGQVRDALAPATPVTATAEVAAPVTAAPMVTPTAVATPTATTTAAPAAAVVAQPGIVSGPELTGTLATPSTQHWLRLEPAGRDAVMKLTLTYDQGANFWVLDDAGLRAVIAGERPHTVNIAAGNRSENAPSNQLSAEVKAAGLSKYTVIVYNDSKGPTSYTLKVENGTLFDDSGQTTGATMMEAPAPAAEERTAATPEAAPTPAVIKRTAKPGETYVVQAGDTLSLIAADIYGSSRLWEKLCIFNQLANCNVLRVGQVLNLPTLEQLNAIQVPSAGAAPAAPAAPAAEATPTPAAPAGEATPTPTPAAPEGEATPTPAAPEGAATPTPTPAS